MNKGGEKKSGQEENGVNGVVGGTVGSISTPMTPSALLRELEVIMGYAGDRLGELGEDGPELDTPEARATAARISEMCRKVEDMVLKSLPEVPFRPLAQVIPSPEAHYFINIAERKATQDSLKREELIRETYDMLIKIFRVKIPGLDVTANKEMDPLRDKIKAFARKYSTSSGLDVKMVTQVFSTVPRNPSDGDFHIGLSAAAIESAFRDASVAELVNNPKTSVFRVGILPSKFFDQFMHDKISSMVMDIENAWQSREMQGGKDQFLSELMDGAKAYIGRTFGFNFLPPDLQKCKSLPELQRFSTELPVDTKSYDLFKKAQFLLRVMHVILLHQSEIDEVFYAENSKNLRADVDNLCIAVPDDKLYINPPRYPDGRPKQNFIYDQNGMVIDRVEVANVKALYSALDKILRKDMYDTTEIGDLARLRIFLCEEDCRDQQSFRKALEKLFGIILARFGNDIAPGSLRWSVSSGKTNESSAGEHRGFHFSLKYKSVCNANELTSSGEPKTRSVDVEFQLLAHMTPEDYTKDTRMYEENKRATLMRQVGVDSDFDSFVMDLISALSNPQYEFNFSSIVDPFDTIKDFDPEFRKVYERQFGIGDKLIFPESVDLEGLLKEQRVLFAPDKLRLFVLLLAILTKKNSDGNLLNIHLFQYMESYFPGKLNRLMDEYLKILQGVEFQRGNKLAYLKRILESRIRIVKNVKGIMDGSKVHQQSGSVFGVEHSLKISGVTTGKKKASAPPKLSLVTAFTGGKGKHPHELETVYDGPIDLVRVPKEGEGVVDFYWLMQDGKRVGPVYRIEEKDDGSGEILCYLLSTDGNSSSQELPLWILQPDYSDPRGLSSNVYSYRHVVVFDETTNIPRLEVSELDTSRFKRLNSLGIGELSPVSGLDGRQARFLNFVGEVKKVYQNEIAKPKEPRGGKHRISCGFSQFSI